MDLVATISAYGVNILALHHLNDCVANPSVASMLVDPPVQVLQIDDIELKTADILDASIVRLLIALCRE